MRARVAAVLLVLGFVPADHVLRGQTVTESQESGAALYRSACAACHGAAGKGFPGATRGFETPLPDFTDCRFASSEADADWIAVVHEGGKARAFDRIMPAFGAALSSEDIERVVQFIRTFCTEPGWPRGELNLPRPLVTEKAYPENELVVTADVTRRGPDCVGNQFLYERRVGRRGQFEIAVPVDGQQDDEGRWHHGVGDMALGYKHVVFDAFRRGSIVSAGGEVLLPTGAKEHGLGAGATVLEPFGRVQPDASARRFHASSRRIRSLTRRQGCAGRLFLARNGGRTLTQRRWHRAWTPMIELLGARNLTSSETPLWDMVPQMQVSLSTRQHVLVNAGVRVPVNHRKDRGSSLMVYLLWDWFDGGFFTGW